MAIRGEGNRRRTGFERVLSWFDIEDDEVETEAAFQTLEDEHLY